MAAFSEDQRKGVLVVDDNESDLVLLRGLFASKDPDLIINTATSEEEFAGLIKCQNGRTMLPDTDIVLLDFNMPRDGGLAILKRMKSDAELRRIPVIVFSGSGSEADVKQAYEMGANSYVVKPVAFEDLSKSVALILEFWLQRACLPHRQ